MGEDRTASACSCPVAPSLAQVRCSVPSALHPCSLKQAEKGAAAQKVQQQVLPPGSCEARSPRKRQRPVLWCRGSGCSGCDSLLAILSRLGKAREDRVPIGDAGICGVGSREKGQPLRITPPLLLGRAGGTPRARRGRLLLGPAERAQLPQALTVLSHLQFPAWPSR